MIQECNLHWRYFDTATNLIFPWYTLPALEWLAKQDVKEWEVFEYGCGYSTIWWRANCRDIISVDHDSVWGRAMDSIVKNDKKDYVEFPGIMFENTSNEMGFDCIIVDGQWRDDCVKYAHACVAHGGYMIIDNYGQTDFPPTEVIDKLLEGWEKQIFKQPNHTDWCTAVFQKP
jgi:hypothetical protein